MVGLDPVLAALSDSAVSVAIDRQIGLSRAGQREAEIASWAGRFGELRRLRQLVGQQASRITELEAKVAALEAELSQVEVAELLAAVSASVANAGRSLEGYAISEATVEVKAAVQIAGKGMLLACDPGGLLAPEALSTVAVRLSSLPPPPGTEQ